MVNRACGRGRRALGREACLEVTLEQGHEGWAGICQLEKMREEYFHKGISIGKPGRRCGSRAMVHCCVLEI